MTRMRLEWIDGLPYWLAGSLRVAAIMGGSEAAADGGEGDGGEGDGDDGEGAPAPTPRAKPKAKVKTGEVDPLGADPSADWFEQLPPEGKERFRELRRTAAGNSKKARDAQAKLDAAQEVTMTTEQRLQVALDRERERAGRAESRLRDQAIRGAIDREGRGQGAKDSATLWRLVDPEDIQWDPENGDVLNAPELVEGLRRNFSWAFEDRRPAAGVDAGRRQAPARRGPSSEDLMNQVIRGRRGA